MSETTQTKRPLDEEILKEVETDQSDAKQPRLDKTMEDGVPRAKGDDIVFAQTSRKGERAENQDRHSLHGKFDCGVEGLKRSVFCCLFDGHAGALAADYCNKVLPGVFGDLCKKYGNGDLELLEKSMKKIFNETYKIVDDKFLAEARKSTPPLKDGSTAITIFFVEDRLYSANAGDSLAYLCRQKSEDELVALSLSDEHTCMHPEERVRIQKAGGSVTNGRLLGSLEPSRGMGDGRYKAHGYICTPAIKKVSLTKDDLFVVCACDGIWKVFKPSEAIKYIYDKYVEKVAKSSKQSTKEIFDEVVKEFSAEAILRGCGDNVSVIIAVFSRNLIKAT